MSIAALSMVFSGYIELVRLGKTSFERYGNHRTISSRFNHRRKALIWQRIWESLMHKLITKETWIGKLVLLIGVWFQRTSTPLVQRGSKMPRVWGVAQAALALRYTLKAEGFGKLMHFILTPGERHDTVAFGALLKGEKVKRLRQGRPKQRSRYLVGDKAYSSRKIRQQLRCSGITPVISCPSNRP